MFSAHYVVCLKSSAKAKRSSYFLALAGSTGAEGERAVLIHFQDNIAVVIMILIDSVKF